MSKPRKIHTIWTLLDSHWCCTLCEIIRDSYDNWVTIDSPSCCLAEYLWMFGFDIPESIDYCLAHSYKAKLKYRVFGNKIHIYLTLC